MAKPVKPDRMLVKMPSLRALKAFIAAAKYQSFTHAAESLCVTQAAISRQIRELEKTLDVDLFKRSGSAIELSPAGQTLFDATYLSFINISQAANRVRADQTMRRELRICASPAFSSLWLAPRLSDFYAKNKNININILTTDEFSSFDLDARPDVSISMNAAYKEGYKAIRLFNECIYPVCSPRYLEDNPDVVSLEGLKKAELLEVSPFRMSQVFEYLDWNFWFYLAEQDLGTEGIELNKSCRANDYNIILQMAMDGRGVALGWDHLVRPLLDQGRLTKPVDVKVDLPEKAHYLFYDAGVSDDDGFMAFRDWFLSCF